MFVSVGTVETYVAGWTPDQVTASDAPLLVAVRSVVLAAKPRSVREARSSLRWGYDYLAASVTAVDGRFDAAMVFAATPVEAYVTGLDVPTGTRDAMRSHLRRMHPEVGFAGTTRTTKTTTAATAAAATPDGSTSAPAVSAALSAGRRVWPVSVVPVSSEVVGWLNGWVPSLLPADRWERVRPLVTCGVLSCAPVTRARVLDLARCVAYLAAWADSTCRPLRPAAVLSASTIEEFLGVLADGGVPVGSLRTFASNLHAVRSACGLPLDVPRMPFERPDMNDPYTVSEVNALYEDAARIRHEVRRREAVWALDLLFATGALPAEVAMVRGVDIVEAASVVVLSSPVRRVPVFERFRTRLADAATETGAGFVLGGTGVVRRNRFRQVLGPTSLGEGGVEVSASRARATWLVEAATTPGLFATLAELWSVTGSKSLQGFDRLAAHIHQHATSDVDVAEGVAGVLQVTGSVGVAV